MTRSLACLLLCAVVLHSPPVFSQASGECSHELAYEPFKGLILVSLEMGDIQVGREKLPGERIIHIDIAYPVTVRYLGGDRTIETDVHVTHVIEVDEAAEARRADAERRERAEIDAKLAAAGEHVGRLKSALRDSPASTVTALRVM